MHLHGVNGSGLREREVPEPDFETQQRPDLLPVILESVLVLLPKSLDAGRLQKFAVLRGGPEQQVVAEFPQIMTHPMAQRNTEAHLSSIDNLLRQQVPEGAFQEVF